MTLENNYATVMIFYSLLTFLVGPKVFKSLNMKHKDPYMTGMIIGFMVSLVLWKQYGKKMVN